MDPIADQIIAALRRIIHTMDVYSRFLATRYGLTVPQLTALRTLSARQEMSIGGLTRAVHLSQPTVTGILDRLEDRGLVARHRSPEDRRRVEVRLTPAGQEVLAQAPPLFQDGFATKLKGLEEWERSLILSALQRLVLMMEAGPGTRSGEGDGATAPEGSRK